MAKHMVDMSSIPPLEVPSQVRDWIVKVRANNAKYEQASLMEKRVMLAQDVLSALQSGRYLPSPGIYQPSVVFTGKQHSLPAVMNLWGLDCRVCAKGAIFVSRLDRLNGMEVREVYGGDLSSRVTEFSFREMCRIESLFEGNLSFLRRESDRDTQYIEAYQNNLYLRCVKRRDRKMRYSEWVLRELMKNIIRHKGRLVIPGLKEPRDRIE